MAVLKQYCTNLSSTHLESKIREIVNMFMQITKKTDNKNILVDPFRKLVNLQRSDCFE